MMHNRMIAACRRHHREGNVWRGARVMGESALLQTRSRRNLSRSKGLGPNGNRHGNGFGARRLRYPGRLETQRECFALGRAAGPLLFEFDFPEPAAVASATNRC